jgi:hypothetical protein
MSLSEVKENEHTSLDFQNVVRGPLDHFLYVKPHVTI